MEPVLYWALFFLVPVCVLAGIIGIVKAQRRSEKAYYLMSGVSFLVVVAAVAAIFNQFLLSFAIFVLTGILALVLLPKTMTLYGKEIVKQKQETDASAPLRLRDFLTWKAWIKLRAIHGLRKTLTLYILTNMAILVAFLLAFIAIGLMTPLFAAFYTIFYTAFSFILSYQQFWKVLKEP